MGAFPIVMQDIFATSGLVWRDLLVILGIVLPVLVTVFLYLVKRNIRETAEHHKTKLEGIQKELENIWKDVSRLQQRLERSDSIGTSHQDRCSEKYVTAKQHDRELGLMREQISTITSNTKVATDVMDSVFRLAEKLSRRSTFGGPGEH